jgi:hypothetical protein
MKCLDVENLLDGAAKRQSMPPLQVGVALGAEELNFCRERLGDEHSLGAGQPVGHQLWQMVRRAQNFPESRDQGGEVVAIVVWAASALHLRERDEWIGWDGMTRSRRLGLIVNNSRLLILEKTRQPNLATQSLGAALRALPEQWEAQHGYRPLLAEAFTDLESHHGTSYKASNWQPLGHTKGCSRHRADFYVRHDRPKKLWIYALHPQARDLLCAANLGPEHAMAQIAPTVRSPLKMGQMRSLFEVFGAMKDPRRRSSRRYGLPLMLTLLSLGLLCGGHTLSDVLRAVSLLGQKERQGLGLRKKKGTQVYRVPCYNAFRELLPMIDVEELLRLLSAWLTQHEGSLPRTLAMDGKDLGKQMGQIVSLVNTTQCSLQPQAPAYTVAMSVTPGSGHEQSAAQGLVHREDVHLLGAVLTADALHCQNTLAHEIVAHKGGDYLFSLKGNQPTMQEYARDLLATAPPL